MCFMLMKSLSSCVLRFDFDVEGRKKYACRTIDFFRCLLCAKHKDVYISTECYTICMEREKKEQTFQIQSQYTLNYQAKFQKKKKKKKGIQPTGKQSY